MVLVTTWCASCGPAIATTAALQQLVGDPRQHWFLDAGFIEAGRLVA
ncbi:hypothetical protein FAM14222_002235 [Propionibacterium freudenreichii]|nr:hypothetical protein [Propionibacterium freudenreichii]MDK9593838.1 hypothetical protein [Propionibacterium freudenreichii]